ATGFPNFKTFERQQGRVKVLPPGGRWEATWSLEVFDSAARVAAGLKEVATLQAQVPATVHRTPHPKCSPAREVNTSKEAGEVGRLSRAVLREELSCRRNKVPRDVMRAEIISIGTELTTGRNLDTNAQWLSRRLAEMGIPVHWHTTIADELDANLE